MLKRLLSMAAFGFFRESEKSARQKLAPCLPTGLSSIPQERKEELFFYFCADLQFLHKNNILFDMEKFLCPKISMTMCRNYIRR